MALKMKIAADIFNSLPDVLKAEYKAIGDEYHLDTDAEDTGALKRAKDHEKAGRQTAEQKLTVAQAELEELREQIAAGGGNAADMQKKIDAAVAKVTKAHEATVAELNGKLTGRDAFLSKSLVDNVVTQIANEISTSPALIAPHIRARIQANLDGESGPVTVFLDKNGQPSALTVDQFKKEFVDNKDFASIIRGSKASGGAGGTGKEQQTGGAGLQSKEVDLSKLTPQEMVAHVAAKKAAASSES